MPSRASAPAIVSGAEPPASLPAGAAPVEPGEDIAARSPHGGGDPSPSHPDADLASYEPVFSAIARGLREGEGRAPQAMLAALIAWTITVAPAALSRGVPVACVVTAVLAALCGISAPLLALVRRRLARHVGISLFLGLSTTTWLFASPAVQPSRLDPVRAAIGAVAWGVFALSWRDRWVVRRQPEPDRDAPVLQARAHLPFLANALVAAGALTSVSLLVLAWRVRDPDRALFAQAVAVAAGVTLTSAASSVAVARGRNPGSGTRRLPPQAMRALLLLIAFAVVGALLMVIR